jgi:ABC-type transporter Mla maintaining outer membrane lipid asymmetry permease subunit MlaE
VNSSWGDLGIILAGWIGARFAAGLGNMQVTEQI